MATFISLITFTDQGARHITESPDQSEAFKAYAQRIGDVFNDVVYWAIERQKRQNVVVKDLYWTQGLYDGIVILEAPDAETAMSVFLHLDSLGYVRTQSFQAFSKDAMQNILGKLE